MTVDERRFRELLDSVLDANCIDADREELSVLISRNSVFVDELVQQIDTHSLLEWESNELGLQAPLQSAISEILEICDPTPKSSAWWTPARTRRLFALAACIAITCCSLLAWHFMPDSQSPDLVVAGQDPVVGEIAENNLVAWSDKTTALKDHRFVIPGRLKMTSGTLVLRFRSGATLIMTGSSSLEIVSGMHVRLDNGQATAHVPQWAKGFTVETSNCEVVDLGTQFGIIAHRGKTTDVVVFEGEVDLKTTTEIPTRRLTAGEGLRVSGTGALSRIVNIQRNPQGEKWLVDRPVSDVPVIASIHDNIRPADSAKYYQVTPKGLVDDARAYVDRPHQWNGVTKKGLPDFLRNADYVRTFNDYKFLDELEIVVELSRPANVYILFDDRVTYPKWLTDQFKNTGAKIGLDEGPWPEINPTNPKLSIAVGAGVSVDNVFSVWHRRCEKADTLIVGSMGGSRETRAIYGIAATPLD